MKYPLVIFDWDGTLMDSIPKIVLSVQQTATLCGLEPPASSVVKGIVGLGLPEAINTLYPELTRLDIEAFMQCYGKTYRSHDEDLSPMFPGAKVLLDSLQKAGVRLAIATGKSRVGLDRVLSASGCSTFFSHSRCSDETHSKPHPAMVHELLSETKFRPEQAVLVGDSVFDMEMAKRANIARVAVGFGAGDLDQLCKYEPSLCVNHLEELLYLIE